MTKGTDLILDDGRKYDIFKIFKLRKITFLDVRHYNEILSHYILPHMFTLLVLIHVFH